MIRRKDNTYKSHVELLLFIVMFLTYNFILLYWDYGLYPIEGGGGCIPPLAFVP